MLNSYCLRVCRAHLRPRSGPVLEHMSISLVMKLSYRHVRPTRKDLTISVTERFTPIDSRV